MPNQKGNTVLIILGVIVVAIIVGGVGYFFVQKPAQEEKAQKQKISQQQKNIINKENIFLPDEYNTFISKELGIFLKYPKKWGIMEEGMRAATLSGEELFFDFSWKEDDEKNWEYASDINFKITGGMPQVWEFYPPLLFDYGGELLEDACQKNAYLDNLYKGQHTINFENCAILELGNGLKSVVFNGTYAENYAIIDSLYDYDPPRIIPPEQRTYLRFKGAIMQLKSQKYQGLTIWIDERFIRMDTNFNEQEKDFDKIINSLSFIR